MTLRFTLFISKPMMSLHFIRVLMIIMTIKLRLVIINLCAWNKRPLMAIIKAVMSMPVVNRLRCNMTVLLWRWPFKTMIMIKCLHPRECWWWLVIVILSDGSMPLSFFLKVSTTVVFICFSPCFRRFTGFVFHQYCFYVITHMAAFLLLPAWDGRFTFLFWREGWCTGFRVKLFTVDSNWWLLPYVELCIWLVASIHGLLMQLSMVHLNLWLLLLLVILSHLFLCHSLLCP